MLRPATIRTGPSGRALRAFVAILASIAVMLGGALTIAPAANATGTASISGQMTFPATTPESPSVFAYTLVSDDDGDHWDFVTSGDIDTDGSYTLAGLDAGTYKVEFAADGYLTEYWQNATSIDAATPVTLVDDEAKLGIDATMNTGAQISGNVIYAGTAGTLPPLAEATAFVDDGEDWTFAGHALIGDDGDYAISNLPAGDYKVQFSGGGYLDEYWDDKATIDDATTITLTTDQFRSGVDATVAKEATISGHVAFTGAAPADPFAMAIAPIELDGGGTSWEPVGFGNIGPDGNYTITGLHAGTYKVEFYAEGYMDEYWDDAPSLGLASDVVLTAGQNRTGIDADLETGASISGTITSVPGVSPEDVHVHILQFVGGDWETVNTASPAANGSYTVSGLAPGTYALEVHDFEGDTQFPDQYYPGVSDPNNATTFTLAKNQARTGFNYTIRTSANINVLSSTTTLTLPATARAYGLASTAKVTVTGGTTTATGTVTLKDGASVIASGTLVGGTATLAVPKTLKVGTHALTAVYAGAGMLAASTSASRGLIVTKAKSTTTQKLVKTKIKTTAKGKVKVTVKATGLVPTGTVTIKEGTKIVGKATLYRGSVTVTLKKLKKGKHKLRAVYGGSTTVAGSSAAKVTLTVKAA